MNFFIPFLQKQKKINLFLKNLLKRYKIVHFFIYRNLYLFLYWLFYEGRILFFLGVENGNR